MRPLYWILAEIMANLGIAILGISCAIILGFVFYGMRYYGNLVGSLIAFILSGVSFLAFGYLIANLVNFPRSASSVGQLLYVPMLILSGVVVPIAIFPDNIQSFVNILPMTHIGNLMQSGWRIFWEG